LINGLLHLSRTGRIVLSIKKLDVNKLMNDVIKSFNYQLTECNAQLVIPHLSDCYGDVNLLNQVFSNIIGNAIKYRDSNRKLEIEITSTVEMKRIRYSIKDNGIGINERQLEKIWDIFYRVDASSPEAGEGLGLSLARRIVEKHKGKIWAESEVNVGSVFHIELQKNHFES
jgi:signal transduction histidine kinase